MNEREDARYRTFWPRLGAMFLDGAVLAPFAWLDQLIFNHTAQAIVLLPWVVLYSSTGLVYEVAFIAMYGQTLGKMACGVRVYDVSGRPVALTQAIVRHIVPILVMPYFAFLQVQNVLAGHLANRAMGEFSTFRNLFLVWMGWVLLEVITMLTNRKRRALHDFIAGTVVVRESARTPLRWWLAGLLVLSFVVPHFIEERNIAVPAAQFQPAP